MPDACSLTRVLAVSSVLFLALCSASAAERQGAAIPAYDIEKLCSALSEGTADPERAEFLCIALEKQQRSRIAHQNVTGVILRKCLDAERLGSYFSLNTCLNEASKRLSGEVGKSREHHRKSGGAPVPVYDVGAYCRRAVKAFNGSGSLELDCRMREQEALRQILEMDAEGKAMRLCLRTTESVKGGYVLLRDCLINEQKKEKR